MQINAQQYAKNEAWLLFQLNELPVHSKSEGDFNVLCVMDVGAGLILSTVFLSASSEEPSESESRQLLASSESKVGIMPKYLMIGADQKFGQIAKVATDMGVTVIVENAKNLAPLTQTARESFTSHMQSPRH